MITRTRCYLPHTETPHDTYFVTFRLYDSLPQSIYLQYRQELEFKQRLKARDPLTLLNLYEAKIQNYLDASCGQCFLRDPRIARLVAEAFRGHSGDWYVLHAYTIMPNHVHVLISLKEVKPLSEIVRMWKGSSSFYANRLLERAGAFWQREYFERTIRSQRQFEYTIRYIFRNPVKAGLCKEVFQWPWTGSSPEIHWLLKRFFV